MAATSAEDEHVIARHTTTLPEVPTPPVSELERAKLDLLNTGRRWDPSPARRWSRHPALLGAGIFVAGLLIGRFPLLRGLVAAGSLVAARTFTSRITGGLTRHLRL
jgi:hypothetical protein